MIAIVIAIDVNVVPRMFSTAMPFHDSIDQLPAERSADDAGKGGGDSKAHGGGSFVVEELEGEDESSAEGSEGGDDADHGGVA